MSKKNIDKPEWFTIKEAADYLQIGEPTLYRWMRDGKITFRKIGDSTRFLQQDLDEIVVVHQSDRSINNNPRCQLCGSSNLVHGKCQSTGLLYFVPEQAKFWTLKTSNVSVKSIMCSKCGNINFIGDKSHLENIVEQNQDEENEDDC
ncbi:MAG: helix-turn-helix domain-containing protein [Lentisphaeraceae bacterium]|nr:helix-turn-helix domain-containing protein [Lentisphaeraceae bacterium]